MSLLKKLSKAFKHFDIYGKKILLENFPKYSINLPNIGFEKKFI